MIEYLFFIYKILSSLPTIVSFNRSRVYMVWRTSGERNFPAIIDQTDLSRQVKESFKCSKNEGEQKVWNQLD